MRTEKNESGLTLVEVMATFVILSLILILVFSILFSGLKISNQAESNSSLQQEVNYLVFALKKLYEIGDEYTITVDDVDKVTINKGEPNEQVIGKKHFDYKITVDGMLITKIPELIEPNDGDKKIEIDVTIIDTRNEKESSIKTTLSRL